MEERWADFGTQLETGAAVMKPSWSMTLSASAATGRGRRWDFGRPPPVLGTWFGGFCGERQNAGMLPYRQNHLPCWSAPCWLVLIFRREPFFEPCYFHLDDIWGQSSEKRERIAKGGVGGVLSCENQHVRVILRVIHWGRGRRILVHKTSSLVKNMANHNPRAGNTPNVLYHQGLVASVEFSCKAYVRARAEDLAHAACSEQGMLYCIIQYSCRVYFCVSHFYVKRPCYLSSWLISFHTARVGCNTQHRTSRLLHGW